MPLGSTLRTNPDPSLALRMTGGRFFHTFSAIGHSLQLFGIARPLHRDFGCSPVDLAEIVGRYCHSCRSNVLLQARRLRGAGDWNNPRLFGKQPRERAFLLRSRCVIGPASSPASHDATLPHTPARCASHTAHGKSEGRLNTETCHSNVRARLSPTDPDLR